MENSHGRTGNGCCQSRDRLPTYRAGHPFREGAAEGGKRVMNMNHASRRQLAKPEEQVYARCVVGVIMDGVELTAREEAAKVPAESGKVPTLVSDVVQLGTE